jgi:hypothetical protein
MTDETCAISGRPFRCKKIHFEDISGLKGTVWLSVEAKGLGIVKAEIISADGTGAIAQLVGFGTRNETTWGKSPEQSIADLEKENPDTKNKPKGK